MGDDKDSSNENHTTTPAAEPENCPSKYMFQCQRCGQYREKNVVVSIKDLERWGSDLTLPSLLIYQGEEHTHITSSIDYDN